MTGPGGSGRSREPPPRADGPSHNWARSRPYNLTTSMSVIEAIGAREILDSRGNPTGRGRSAAHRRQRRPWRAFPRARRTGAHEAVEVRDGDASRFGGKGVIKAVHAVEEEIAARDRGRQRVRAARHRPPPHRARRHAEQEPPGRQRDPRRVARGVEGRCRIARPPPLRYLGGPQAHILPVPLMNVINGGAHANNALELQEFMVAPVGAVSYAEGLRWGVEVFHALRSALNQKGLEHRRGRRGRVRTQRLHRRRGSGDARPGHRGCGPGGRQEVALAMDSRPRSSSSTVATAWRARIEPPRR